MIITEYTQGTWYAVVAEGLVVMLDPTASAAIVRESCANLRQGGGLDGQVALLAHLRADDLPDLARGATLLGTGGGGDPYVGQLMVANALGSRSITVLGSNAAQASAFPPNNRAMVCVLLPAFGKKSPATSRNALNFSGCITVRSTAQVPPIDHPATPQLDRSRLTPKFENI